MTKLSFKEKVGYGLGDTASNFVWALMMNFILYFYTDIFGISAAVAGTIFLIARTTDGVADFAMGAIADRTKTKWGSFRPYLLWMCVPLAIIFVLTFTTPNLDASGKAIYAGVTYVLLMLLYTAINIPYGALSGVMTDDPDERTSINSFRMALAQVGGLIANGFFVGLVAYFGVSMGSSPQTGAQRTVLLYSVIAVILFLITFATTKERIRPPVTQKTSLSNDLKTLFGNPHWVMMLVGALVNITFAVVRGSVTVYYLKKYFNFDDGRVGTFFIIFGISMAIGAALTKFLVKAIGKKHAFVVSMTLCGVTAFPLYWIPSDSLALMYGVQIIGALVSGIQAALYWSMVADTADYSEWKFKVRNTGIFFSATTFAQKVGMGLGGFMAGMILDHFQYDGKAEVLSPGALHGVLLMIAIIPGIGQTLLGLYFLRYGLTEEVATTVREELAKRRLEQGNAAA